MTADTTGANREMTHFDQHDDVWLFGYGSLIFKVDFPVLERRPATVLHWERRLWQGSHDHRGTPGAPGRVVTLVPAPDAACAGMAYRVSTQTFGALDHREKNGYLRHVLELHFNDAGGGIAEGLVYIATATNGAWLGPLSEARIARHIAASEGPSGHNADYVLRLADALRALGSHDEHIFCVEQHLRRLLGLHI